MAYEEVSSVIINEETDSPISVSLVRDAAGDKVDIRYMYRDGEELRHTKRGIRIYSKDIIEVRNALEDIIYSLDLGLD